MATREQLTERESDEADERAGDDRPDAPTGPTDLRKRAWGSAFRRAVRKFRADELTDVAAALTYYGILAIFPAIIALVSILGLVGRSATQPLVENISTFAPGPATRIVTSAIQNLNHNRGTAGVILIAGIAVALWSASGYVAAFMRASNRIYEVGEGRPFWKTVPVRVSVTVVTVVLLALSSIAVVLTGGLAKHAGDLIGVGSTAVTVWDIAKWPVLVVLVSFMLALLYWASPNVRNPGFRWLTPGGLLAVAAWLIASGAFALYVAGFSSYNKTYGALGAVVVFLVWLWISNIAILFGAEFNAELERGRSIEAGDHVEGEPYLELRDTRKLKETSS